MAPKAKEATNWMVAFYLYSDEWTIHKKTKKIYSPFNVMTFNPRDPKFDIVKDPKYVVFINGVYETDDEEEISFLDLYNHTGGILEIKQNWETIKKFFKWWVNIVKREAPIETRKERIVEKEVEVQKLPRVVVEMFTIEQLQELCKSWQVLTTDAVKKEDYIKLLEESGKLS